MKRTRPPQQERHNSSAVRQPAHEAHDWDRQQTAPADQSADEIDGQLGPDELPDPAEVIMSREAKLHR